MIGKPAQSTFRRGEADNAGIVDHVTFVVMRRLGLTRAFTNDRHFPHRGLRDAVLDNKARLTVARPRVSRGTLAAGLKPAARCWIGIPRSWGCG